MEPAVTYELLHIDKTTGARRGVVHTHMEIYKLHIYACWNSGYCQIYDSGRA